jgi:hypothetical protein
MNIPETTPCAAPRGELWSGQIKQGLRVYGAFVSLLASVRILLSKAAALAARLIARRPAATTIASAARDRHVEKGYLSLAKRQVLTSRRPSSPARRGDRMRRCDDGALPARGDRSAIDRWRASQAA